jgi:hypothetical protein
MARWAMLTDLVGWVRTHRFLVVLLGVPALHVCVWLAFGQRLLIGQLPRMVYADFHDEYRPGSRGLMVVEGIEQLPPGVVVGLGSVFAERGSKVLPHAAGRKLLEDCRSRSPRDGEGCTACGHLEHGVRQNNPLYARYATTHTPCGGYCSVYGHLSACRSSSHPA